MEGQVKFEKDIKSNTRLITVELNNSVIGKVYIVKGFRNEKNWEFKIGDRVGGLMWFSEIQKIIDADSPVYPLD